jgi:arginase
MVEVLNVLGVPTSAGAYAPGQERAPSAFREHGLVEALASTGWWVRDRGDVHGVRWRPDPDRPEAMNVPDVVEVARSAARRVGQLLDAGEHVLVLGGDCSIEVGVVAGALASGASVGLVYIDLDADLKVPATGEGALDWMGVAHLLDVPGADPSVAGSGPRRPMLAGSDVLLLSQGNITDSEAEIVRERGIEVIPLAEVHDDPVGAADRAAAWASRHDRLLVHVDVDVLRWVDFPIAENSRRADGLTLDELGMLLGRLVAAPAWRALTVCEVNPDHAPDEAASFARLNRMLAEAFSRCPAAGSHHGGGPSGLR